MRKREGEEELSEGPMEDGGRRTKRTSHKERRSGMERSARGGERASIAILHRTEIDTGTAGVTGCEGGRVASRGFLYFS